MSVTYHLSSQLDLDFNDKNSLNGVDHITYTNKWDTCGLRIQDEYKLSLSNMLLLFWMIINSLNSTYQIYK